MRVRVPPPALRIEGFPQEPPLIWEGSWVGLGARDSPSALGGRLVGRFAFRPSDQCPQMLPGQVRIPHVLGWHILHPTQ